MNQLKLEKWKKWIGDGNLTGSICHELTNLALIRKIQSGLRDMVSANPELQKHSAFYAISNLIYGDSVLMYIRRQVRRDCDSVSLIKLLDDLKDNSSMITRDFFVSLYVKGKCDSDIESFRRLGERDFNKYFSEDDSALLSISLVEKDIAILKDISSSSADYIDRRLAHLDKREPKNIPTIEEIEKWCDTVNLIFKKYILLLTASDYKIEPILFHDWKAIFRSAWIKS